MKTIKLYGHLGKQFGKIHKYYVNSPSEAVRLLCANYKGFEAAILGFTGEGYRVIVGNEDADIEDFHNTTGKEVIKIIPVISGQGGNGLGMIIMGAALMVAAPWAFGLLQTSMAAAAGGAALSEGAILGMQVALYASNAAASFGMSMILSGVAQMLYVPPPPPARQAVSGAFDGAVNTTRQGMPIAVGYGELTVGSAVISAGLSSVSVPV